ncbi:signal peptidase I [Paenibacillus sp. GCM10023248]|uniref:signal peptidase I n=1 Tax=unclassified Paenibacillus TaxID=185978 RepID=UPI002379DFD2|nr:signal peptidase I [Paenibacillus sp. MAHUQ-63]MDD9271099.1 signal peptidase I [Paenibacillus sp. MAHUQ-63]
MSFFVGRNESNKAASSSGTGKQTETRSLTHELWDWTKSILVALLVVILVHQYGFNLSTVHGHSMDPTLQEGEWLFVNRAVTYLKAPGRGEIVILKENEEHAFTQHAFLVKRVVAVGGDEVQGIDGALYVNGRKLEEPYTNSLIEDGDFGPARVRDGHVFVMGDNRHASASADSRRFGDVPASMIQGRAEYVLWPFAMAAKLD